MQRADGVVWGVEMFARPGRDVFLLGEQDDLPVRGDLQQKVEDVTRLGLISVHCHICGTRTQRGHREEDVRDGVANATCYAGWVLPFSLRSPDQSRKGQAGQRRLSYRPGSIPARSPRGRHPPWS